MKNTLYYGDCLDILRRFNKECVDLIYLDPPFNSNKDYNVFLPGREGMSNAQIIAFKDAWYWGEQTQKEFDDILKHPEGGQTSNIINSFRDFLGENDLMAYIVMMTARLIELKRVLKNTGSLYLHCDPTASHYLKIILDGLFGISSFRTEISWRRSSAHNDAKQGRKQYGNIRDSIFYYTKGKNWVWNWQYTPYTEEYIKKNYRHIDANGRRYRLALVS